jgi:hypothetical protein
MRGTIRVLIEATEADEVIVPEKFNLFAYLFHLNIFSREGMNREHLVYRAINDAEREKCLVQNILD